MQLKQKIYLSRSELADKFFGYHLKHNIKDAETANEYLSSIINNLDSYQYAYDDNFVFVGRKKIIYDELMDIINGTNEVDNPIYFMLGTLEEFMCNDNFINPSTENYLENRDKNDKYNARGIICEQEKELILDMITKIHSFIIV